MPYPLVTPGAKYYTDGSEIYYLETSFYKKSGYENVYNVNTQSFIGITDQKLGWKPKSVYQFFDFQIGDVVKYEESNTTGFQQICITTGSATIKILDKIISKDSLIYNIKKLLKIPLIPVKLPLDLTFQRILKLTHH